MRAFIISAQAIYTSVEMFQVNFFVILVKREREGNAQYSIGTLKHIMLGLIRHKTVSNFIMYTNPQ